MLVVIISLYCMYRSLLLELLLSHCTIPFDIFAIIADWAYSLWYGISGRRHYIGPQSNLHELGGASDVLASDRKVAHLDQKLDREDA